MPFAAGEGVMLTKRSSTLKPHGEVVAASPSRKELNPRTIIAASALAGQIIHKVQLAVEPHEAVPSASTASARRIYSMDSKPLNTML